MDKLTKEECYILGKEDGIRATFKHFRDLEERRAKIKEHEKIHQSKNS